MVGVIYQDNFATFNLLMRDGSRGSLPYSEKREIKQKFLDQVFKIAVYQPSNFSFLYGFQFYNINGQVMLEVGKCTIKPIEFELEMGERVLGIRSRLEGTVPFHNDL